MGNRDEFAQMLYQTFYNNITAPDEVKRLLTPLRDWIKENIPKKLYRFRSVSKYSINALQKDEIWGSTIQTFNDPFECLPCYNIDTINQYIDNEFSVSLFNSKLQQVTANNIPKEITDTFPPEIIENMRVMSTQLVDNPFLPEYLRQAKQMLISQWVSQMEKFRTQFILDILRHENLYNIACFSESYRSTLMWAHYANSHSGFCVEYDIKSPLVECLCNCGSIHTCPGFMLNFAIAPVIYQEKRYDASAGFMSMLVNWAIENNKIPMSNHYYDMFLPTKTMLTKHKSWEYEQEWRLFKRSSPEAHTNHAMIALLKPTAVYLGARIKEHNKKRLINICREKCIPCYQMLPQYFTSTYESEAYQLL